MPANSRSNEEDEDENDENLDLMVARPARANQRKAFQQVNDDGLDPYLEDCLEEREFNGRANVNEFIKQCFTLLIVFRCS